VEKVEKARAVVVVAVEAVDLVKEKVDLEAVKAEEEEERAVVEEEEIAEKEKEEEEVHRVHLRDPLRAVLVLDLAVLAVPEFPEVPLEEAVRGRVKVVEVVVVHPLDPLEEEEEGLRRVDLVKVRVAAAVVVVEREKEARVKEKDRVWKSLMLR